MYLDDLCKSRVFAFFVLNELHRLRVLAAELRRLFLELLPSLAFKLETHNPALYSATDGCSGSSVNTSPLMGKPF